MSLVLIGERINTSVKKIRSAVKKKDAAVIKDIARKQDEAGVHYLDINCETEFFNEKEHMKWLVKIVQQETSKPLCIASQNPEVLEAGLELHKNGQPLINHVTAEKEKFKTVTSLALRYNAKIIALLKDDSGIPQTTEEKVNIADTFISELAKRGISQKNIFVDPFVKPISTGSNAGIEVLETFRRIKEKYPGIYCLCGVSNISYGLPNRKILNHAFMVQSMAFGAEAFILNPLDNRLMGFIYASQVLLGRDQFCSEFLTAHRKGLYEGLD